MIVPGTISYYEFNTLKEKLYGETKTSPCRSNLREIDGRLASEGNCSLPELQLRHSHNPEEHLLQDGVGFERPHT